MLLLLLFATSRYKETAINWEEYVLVLCWVTATTVATEKGRLHTHRETILGLSTGTQKQKNHKPPNTKTLIIITIIILLTTVHERVSF